MTPARSALIALCILTLASAGCGRYGPPRRTSGVGAPPPVEVEKKAGTPTEQPAPSDEPKEEKEEPQSR